MIETRIFDFHGPSLRMERGTDEGPLAALRLASSVLAGFEWLVPMAVELDASPSGASRHRAFAGLVERGLAHEPRWTYIDTEVTEVERIDRGALDAWTASALGDAAGATWSSLDVIASRTRLSVDEGPWIAPAASGEQRTIELVKHESGAWYVSAFEPSEEPAPVELRVAHARGRLRLSIEIRWSKFTEPASPGRRWLEASVVELLDQGWALVRRPPRWSSVGHRLPPR